MLSPRQRHASCGGVKHELSSRDRYAVQTQNNSQISDQRQVVQRLPWSSACHWFGLAELQRSSCRSRSTFDQATVAVVIR